MTRKVLGLVVWAALCALPGGAQGAEAETTAAPTIGAVDPGSVVDVDLKAGRFTDPLPFDVPFYIRGDRDATTTEIRAKVLQFPDPENCETEESLFEAKPDDNGVVKSLGRREKDQVILRDLGLATKTEEKGHPQFLLQAPALPVNRSYCFRWGVVRDVTDAEVKQFQAEAFQAVDEELRKPAGDTQLAARFEQVRRDVISRIQGALKKNERLMAPQGTFFNPDAQLDEVELARREKFNDILSRGGSRADALTGFRDQQGNAFRELSSLAGSDAYRKVTQALAQRRAGNTSLGELLQGKPGALDLAAVRANDLDEVAVGLPPGVAANPASANLDKAFAPGDLDDRLTRLRTTVAGLRDLGDVVEQLERNQALRTAAGLDDQAGQKALADLKPPVKTASDAVELVRRRLLRLQETLTDRTGLIRQFVSDLRPEMEEKLSVAGTTLAGYTLRASWYVSADVGIGVANEIDKVFPYMGANIYFQPVNKRAKLGPLFGPQKDFWKRFALVVGLPQEKMEVPGRLRPVLQDRPLVVGAGLRINDLLRMTLGGLVFEKDDPDPLVTQSDGLTATWFLSFSIDWDVRSNFAPVFKGLGMGQTDNNK
jgi:hypothetical protein